MLFRRRRILRLDEPCAAEGTFERVESDEDESVAESLTYSQEDVHIWLEELIKQASAAQVISIELLRDKEARCLRQLFYRPVDGEVDQAHWCELAPMAWSFVECALDYLQHLARLSRHRMNGFIKCEHLGSIKEVPVMQVDENLYLLHLTDDRPEPVHKTDQLIDPDAGHCWGEEG